MGVTPEQLLGMLSASEASLATVSGDLALVMRRPEPNEVQVPVDSEIHLRLVSLLGDPTIAGDGVATLEVRVDGTLVFDLTGGLFVDAGWQGASNAQAPHAVTDPYTFHEVWLDQTAPAEWTTEQVITVQVDGTDHLANPFTATYTFTVLDITAPQLLGAEALDGETIRLEFSEPMATEAVDGGASLTSATTETWNLAAAEDLTAVINSVEQTVTLTPDMFLVPAAATAEEVANALAALFSGVTAADVGGAVVLTTTAMGDTVSLQVTGGSANALLQFPTTVVYGSSVHILAAENFTITRHNVFPEPAVNLTVTAARAVTGSSDTQVDLLTQWPMTPGAPYRVTVDTDVTDAHTVPIDPAALSADFTGWSPPWPARRKSTLALPQKIFDDDATQHARAIVNCFQRARDLQLHETDVLFDPVDPDLANDGFVDLHLYDLGNPFEWTDLDLTPAERRKLMLLLPDLYPYRGTNTGIEAAILILLGLDVTVVGWADDSWILGESYLGDYFPAIVPSVNAETYNLAAGTPDLWVAIDGGKPVLALSQAGQTFTIDGLWAAQFPAGRSFQVVESTGNDGSYTVAAGVVESGGQTVVPVTGAIASAVTDGRIVDRAVFSTVGGVDFVNPAAATAQEVDVALDSQLYGGAGASFDIGAGARVIVWTTNPDGSVQVLGGTANVALAFSTTLVSATGGCILGPGTERGLRTFDIVAPSSITSLEETLIERIAVRFKTVNTHFNRVRLAYIAAEDPYWRVGVDMLGEGTVLG